MAKDFITLQRRILDSWMWELPAGQTKVGITLLLMANWKEGKTFSGGKMVTIFRGQTMTSLEALAARSRVSVQTVRTTLRNLEAADFITCRTTNRFSVITILNYDREQGLSSSDQQADQHEHRQPEQQAQQHAQQHKTNTVLTRTATTIEPVNQGTKEPVTTDTGPVGLSALSAGKRSVLKRHLAEAQELWSIQDRLRERKPLKPTAERLLRVAERLDAGASFEECETVLRAYASEAKRNRDSARWFNGETNWRKDNFDRTLGSAAAMESQLSIADQWPDDSNETHRHFEEPEL